MSELDPLSPFRLDGRVAIVTGASSGLGDRFARVLHSVGATVCAVGRRQERLDELASSLDRCHAFPADLLDPIARERIVSDVIDLHGRLDVLINNAGMATRVAVEDESVDLFRMTMELNVTAPWHLSKLAAPHMIEAGGGTIVNVASMLGHVGSTPVKQASYCASKGALINLTRELALQWARKGVTVNALCPGYFPSEMTAGMGADEGSRRYIESMSPIPRLGQTHELDSAILMLTSSANTYMTGQRLIVDGGWTAR